jgi:hypothetical protein
VELATNAHQVQLDGHELGDALGIGVLEDHDRRDLARVFKALVLGELLLVRAGRCRLAVEEVVDVLHAVLVELVFDRELLSGVGVALALRAHTGSRAAQDDAAAARWWLCNEAHGARANGSLERRRARTE